MPTHPPGIFTPGTAGGEPSSPPGVFVPATSGGGPSSPPGVFVPATSGGGPSSPPGVFVPATSGGGPSSPPGVFVPATGGGVPTGIPDTLSVSGLMLGATEIGAGEYTRWTDLNSKPRWYLDSGLIRYWFEWDIGENCYFWNKGQESEEGAGDWEIRFTYRSFLAAVTGGADPWLAQSWYFGDGYTGTPRVTAAGQISPPPAIFNP